MSVCLFACLLVCPLTFLKNYASKISPNFLYILPGRCVSYFLWLQCNALCTFNFVDDIMFPCNGENRPESKTTCMFCPVRQVAAPGRSLPSLNTFCFFRKKILYATFSVCVWVDRRRWTPGKHRPRVSDVSWQPQGPHYVPRPHTWLPHLWHWCNRSARHIFVHVCLSVYFHRIAASFTLGIEFEDWARVKSVVDPVVEVIFSWLRMSGLSSVLCFSTVGCITGWAFVI